MRAELIGEHLPSLPVIAVVFVFAATMEVGAEIFKYCSLPCAFCIVRIIQVQYFIRSEFVGPLISLAETTSVYPGETLTTTSTTPIHPLKCLQRN